MEICRTVSEVSIIMNIVRFCNTFSYFLLFRRGLFEQVNGLSMGAPLSPLLANCLVETVETIALDTYFLKHKLSGEDTWVTQFQYGIMGRRN